MAEQSSFETAAVNPAIVEDLVDELPEESQSVQTSGADVNVLFDYKTPMDDLHHEQEKVADSLDHEEENPVLTAVTTENVDLTQEELDHIAYIERMAEQSSFEVAAANPDSVYKTTSSGKNEAQSLGFVSDFRSSEATQNRKSNVAFDTFEKENPHAPVPDRKFLTQKELEHIANVEKLADQSGLGTSCKVNKVEEKIPTPKDFMPAFLLSVMNDCEKKIRAYAENDHLNEDQKKDRTVSSKSCSVSPCSEKEQIEKAYSLPPGYRRTSIVYSSSFKSSPASPYVESNIHSATDRSEKLKRESSVHVVYTDHSLKASQSSQQDENDAAISSNEDSSSYMKELKEVSSRQPWEDIGISENETPKVSPTCLRRSLSDIVIDTLDIPKEQLRASYSASCVNDKCEACRIAHNAFESCEQHSYIDSKDLLCNVDFLCRLNFAANRMTEDIAEVAGRDLQAYYRSQSNPRARYFSDNRYEGKSDQETDSDEESKLKDGLLSALSAQESQPFGLFSFFSPKKNASDRPRSALSFLSGPERKPRKQSDDKPDFIQLIRRSSRVEARGSIDNSVRLPDDALQGLSEQERDHILQVLNKSARSISPSNSRRPSSVLQTLPDLEKLSQSEREHIESVLQKVEQKPLPFMIPVHGQAKRFSRGESLQTEATEPYSGTSTNSGSMDVVHEIPIPIILPPSTVNSHETPILAGTPENQPTISESPSYESEKASENVISQPVPPIAIQTPPQSAHSDVSKNIASSFGFQSPSLGGLKSFFGKATQQVKQAADSITKEAGNKESRDIFHPSAKSSITSNVTEEELKHIEEVIRKADMSQKLSTEISLMEQAALSKPALENSDLTEEELNHIKRINEQAQYQLMLLQSHGGEDTSPSKKMRNSELAADFDDAEVSDRQHPAKNEEEQTRLDQSRSGDAHNVPQKVIHDTPRKSLMEPDLTEAELSHIRRIQEMADIEFAQHSPVPSVPQLTADEIEHIMKVQEMAEQEILEMENQQKRTVVEKPKEVSNDQECLTAEEWEHIQQIQRMAESDSLKTNIKENIEYSELSQEELDHIRRVQEEADSDFNNTYIQCQPSPSSAEVGSIMNDRKRSFESNYSSETEPYESESHSDADYSDAEVRSDCSKGLTAAELEHIDRVRKLAEHELASTRTQNVLMPPVQSEQLSAEEMEHIRRIAELAERDFIPSAGQAELLHKKVSITSNLGMMSSPGESLDMQPINSQIITSVSFNSEKEVDASVRSDVQDGLPSLVHSDVVDLPTPHVSPIHAEDEEMKSPIHFVSQHDEDYSDASSHERSSRSMPSARSSDFDIKSVNEMRQEIKSNIGHWYEEQLSFMKETIQDEEANSDIVEDQYGAATDDEMWDYAQDDMLALGDMKTRLSTDTTDRDNQNNWEGESMTAIATASPAEATTAASDGNSNSHTRLGLLSSFIDHSPPSPSVSLAQPHPPSTAFSASTASTSAVAAAASTTTSTSSSTIPSESGSTSTSKVFNMFSTASKPSTSFGFASFGKFASGAIQKAKQAGEQFQAAVDLASPQPSSSYQNFVTSSPTVASSGTSGKVDGLDGLTEEERMKIEAVMACAQLDEQQSYNREDTLSNQMRATQIGSKSFTPEIDITKPSTSTSFIPIDSSSQDEMSSIPPELAHLPPEEREQILRVMRQAENEGIATDFHPPPQPSPSRSIYGGTPSSNTPSHHTRSPNIPEHRIVPSGLEGLSAEEQEQILRVMAEAERMQMPMTPSMAPSPVPLVSPMPSTSVNQTSIPSGLEELSEEERCKILAVMAEAEKLEVHAPPPSVPTSSADSNMIPSSSITRELPLEKLTTGREHGPSSSSPMSSSEMLNELEDLTEEERQKILSVMAAGQADEISSLTTPSVVYVSDIGNREESEIATTSAPSFRYYENVEEDVTYADEILPREDERIRSSDQEYSLESIKSYRDNLELEEEGMRPRSNSQQPIAPIPKPEEISRTIPEAPKSDDNSSWNSQSDSVQPITPKTTATPTPRTATVPTAATTSSSNNFDRSSMRQPSVASSSGWESGYDTTSTSIDRELANIEKSEKLSGLLEDKSELREGARSRSESRHDDEVHEDDDFTYSDQRFISFENLAASQASMYEITQHDEESFNVDAVEVKETFHSPEQEWEASRQPMWTTVFEADEAEQPCNEVFNMTAKQSPKPPTQPFAQTTGISQQGRNRFKSPQSPSDMITMEDIMGDFSQDGSLHEIEFDSTPVSRTPVSTSSSWTPMGLTDTVYQRSAAASSTTKSKKDAPEIKITVHDDSEDEDSASEDDDEYPDKVVAAPTAPTPSFEDVERERELQEQFGKEVLQQIQAFGEAADDEFDVKWAAASMSKRLPPLKVTDLEAELPTLDETEMSTQKLNDVLDLTKHSSSVRNPFLESPEDEDVTIDMEEVDYSEAARFYQAQQSLAAHRPGPVYTIPEDESEDDGTIENSDSRINAREKKRRNARNVAEALIHMYDDKKTTDQASSLAENEEAIRGIPSTISYNFSDIPEFQSRIPTDSRMISSTTSVLTSATSSSTSSIYTSSYLFSTAPFMLPTEPTTTYTTPKIPSSQTAINTSIDKTLSDINDLLNTCSVYTSQTTKPNLLYYDQTAFQKLATGPTDGSDKSIGGVMHAAEFNMLRSEQTSKITQAATAASQYHIPSDVTCVSSSTTTVTSVTTTDSSRHDPNKAPIPYPGTLGGSLVNATVSSTIESPRGLRRSPGMILPPSTTDTIPNDIPDTSSSPHTLDQLNTTFKWVTDAKEDDGLASQEMGRRKLPSIPSYPSYSTIQNYSTNNSALTSSNTTSGYASHQTPSNSIIGSASTWSAGPTGSANAEKNVPISTRGFGSATIMAGSSSYDQNSSLQQHVPVYLSSSAPSTSSAQILTSSAPNLVSAGPIVGTVVQANGMSTSMTSGSASSGYNSGLALYGASAGVPATNVEMTRSSYYTEQPASRPTSALSRPSSALSHISLDTDIISTTSRGDPAIAAGATYQVKPKTAIRQTVSSFVTKQHQPSHHHLVQQSARIPNTLARVLLKKELKEALNRRRETLEACEIEASQRQYVVHKMLVTGLLPENREDDIPRVIRCELPEEIVRGARVIPVQPMSMHLSSTLPKQQPIEQRKSRDQTTSTSFQISSTPVVPPKPPAHANISTMSSTATPPMQHHQQPYFSTSLRQQVESDKYRQFQQKRTAETQTDMTTGDDSGGYARVPLTKERSLSAEPYGIRNPARCFDATVQTQTDLLEATRKYFEDYDRQLKELTEKAKLSSTKQRSFEFHDDDSLSREQRRQQLMEELSRRRERLWQNTQLPSDSLPYRAQFASALHSSDYSSVVPHYGSLPRIDYPSSTPQRRDYTYRSTSLLGNSYDPLTMGPSTYDPLAPAPSARLSRHQQWSSTGASSAMNGRPNAYNYGSLPRNYERCLGQQEPIQIEYEQSFGGKPNTRSLFDIHGIDNISGKDAYGYNVQEMNNARSLNYLDQLHLQQTPSDRLLTLGHHYDGTAPYADRLNNRLANTSNCYTDDAFTLPPYNSQQQDMLSQYANYLSSQFQSNLRSADGTNLASGYPLPNPMPLLSSRYDTGPLSDPYRSTQAIQNSSYPTSRRTVATRYPPSALPPSNIMPNRDGYYPAPMSDPTHVPPMNYHSEYRMPTSQVYSRNEMNYGSRPTHYPTDYGNIGYREALAGRNVMDAYNQNMQQPMAMHPAQQHAAPIQHNSRIPPFASEPASAPIWTSHQPRAQTYQDQNDALSRIYATVGRRRPGTLNPSTPYQSDSPSFIIDGR